MHGMIYPHLIQRPQENTHEKYIDGCKELIDYIVSNQSLEKSIILWSQLLEIISTSGYGGLDYLLRGLVSISIIQVKAPVLNLQMQHC
ncbi:MAG: hypothetical protein ACLSEY_08025 [Enterocloster sp.]